VLLALFIVFKGSPSRIHPSAAWPHLRSLAKPPASSHTCASIRPRKSSRTPHLAPPAHATSTPKPPRLLRSWLRPPCYRSSPPSSLASKSISSRRAQLVTLHFRLRPKRTRNPGSHHRCWPSSLPRSTSPTTRAAPLAQSPHARLFICSQTPRRQLPWSARVRSRTHRRHARLQLPPAARYFPGRPTHLHA
jgi:hypothetical protein